MLFCWEKNVGNVRNVGNVGNIILKLILIYFKTIKKRQVKYGKKFIKRDRIRRKD